MKYTSGCSNMTRQTLSILKSREVIAVNQDPLGVAGDLVWKQGPHEVIHSSHSCMYRCHIDFGTFETHPARVTLPPWEQ